MRLQHKSETEVAALEQFSKWIADIGDRIIGQPNEGDVKIEIPSDILISWKENPTKCIVNDTYPCYGTNALDTRYLQKRAILEPPLHAVESINQFMISQNKNEGQVYRSSDSTCKSDCDILI